MSRLPLSTFLTVVENAPLVSIDLLVDDGQGNYLLGLRNNRPAKNYWFVPGGRIYKNELISSAFSRLSKEELGSSFSIKDADFLGVFEHIYDDNFSDESFTTHYVVLALKVTVDPGELTLPIAQHSRYRWQSVDALCAAQDVHQHSKWYFQDKDTLGGLE